MGAGLAQLVEVSRVGDGEGRKLPSDCRFNCMASW